MPRELAKEDRVDKPKRDRIDELVESWHEATRRLDRRYWRATAVSVGTGILVLFVIVWVWSISNRNTKALCAFRSDLQVRVDTSEKFLARSPRGLPGVLSALDVRTNIDNQKRTISTLEGLDCRGVQPTLPVPTPVIIP